MVSPELQAVLETLRARRAAPPGVVPTMEQARAGAEQLGEATVEPPGVTYEEVDAGGVRAQWVVPERADPDAVLLYFHAGGFAYCSMNSHRKLIGHIARAAGCRALNVDYRLAPENPFPAALDDAWAAFTWLREQGIAAERIGLVGDSAGGGLALSLLVRARDRGASAGAAALMSPWVDLALTGENTARQAETDLVSTPAGNAGCAALYLAGHDSHDPEASPLYADLTGLPPLYVQVGDGELFLDDALRLQEKADLRLDVLPGTPHDFQLHAGRVPEADAAVAELGAFLRGTLGISPRIPPRQRRQFDDETRAALSVLSPPSSSGPRPAPHPDAPVANIVGTFAWHPALAKAFFQWNNHLFHSTLPARERELAIVRTGWLRRGEYEWEQHVRQARRLGVSDAELAAVSEGPDSPVWGAEDAVLLRAVDELVADRLLSDASWAALTARFDRRQVMDLVFTVGNYDLLAMAMNTFGLQLDPDMTGFPPP
jgi:epsilon-lactone hydrolase